MQYLTGEEILVIHAAIIDATGGSHGVRDTGLLRSIIERPKMQFGGKELYRGVFKKAAVYFEAIAHYHVFVDGNKRTAIAAAARFLSRNGYELAVENKTMEQFVLNAVVKKCDLDTIASWLRVHSRPAREKRS
jgi:death-on-curing protein